MEEEKFAVILVFTLVALPGFFGAYLIGVKKALYLIAGWNPEKYHSHDAISCIFSWGLLIFSLMVTMACAALYSNSNEKLFISLILTATAIIFGCSIYINLKFRIKNN